MKNIKNTNKELSIELNLDEINLSLDKLIEHLCFLDNITLIKWSQFTDYAVGELVFEDEPIKFFWEGFPNAVEFIFKSPQKLDKLKRIIAFYIK